MKIWKAADVLKLGGGFYCGKLSPPGRQEPIYVFNAFFMNMRASYTAPGKCIYYYVVEWDTARYSWAQFRGTLLGPTDPANAPPSSARGLIYARWEELGLPGQPNVTENGLH